MGRRALFVLAGCTAACNFSWDDFYPRPGTDGSGGISEGGSGGSSTSTGGAAGSTSENGGAGGEVGGAGGVGGAAPVTFFDNFNRADDTRIGNGWIEKTPAAFDLMGNAAVPGVSAAGYLNNLVFRPAVEALLDVEASVEFSLTSPNGVPQIIARVDHASILTASAYTGYNLWFSSNDTVNIGRQVGGTVPSANLAAIGVSPTITTGQTYRLRLRVEGTDPVLLEGFVERFDGMNWLVIGTASVADSAPERIVTAGAMGFACNTNTAFFYDNFHYQEL